MITDEGADEATATHALRIVNSALQFASRHTTVWTMENPGTGSLWTQSWVAEEILKERTRKGVKQVYIRWMGCGHRKDSWEPAENFPLLKYRAS